MPMSRQELEQIEQSLQQLKLQDLQHIIANLNGSKFGKKAELVQRLTVLLRNPASQDRSFRAIREYQQRMTSSLMRTGYIPPINPYAFGQQPGGSYAYGGQQQFPGPPRAVVGLHPVPLPFFDVIDSIVQPTELPPAAAVHVKLPAKQTVTFTIPVQHANHLNYNSESHALPRYEVQLRFFHLGDNWQQRPQPDDFPLNCQVRLDELNVSLPPVIPTNRQNVEPKRPSRPVNLTPIIQNIGRVGTRQHRLVVDWTADRRAWAFSVNFVYRLNSEILIRRLREKVNCVQPQDVTKQIIIRRLTTGDDDGICLEQIKASVKCPLTRTRLSTPIRCRDCDHLQCYDLENYIQMNEKKPTWKCPVCSHPAPYERLLIDEYFVKVLNETSKDVDEVELLRDGGWKVIVEEAFALSSDDDEDVKPAASTQVNPSTVKTERPSTDSGPPPAKKKCPPPNDDIITLDDSDDDDEIQRATEASLTEAIRNKEQELNASAESANKGVGSPTIPTSSAAQPSTSGVTAPNNTTPVRKNNGNSSNEIEIITLDDTPPRPVALSAQNGGMAHRSSRRNPLELEEKYDAMDPYGWMKRGYARGYNYRHGYRMNSCVQCGKEFHLSINKMANYARDAPPKLCSKACQSFHTERKVEEEISTTELGDVEMVHQQDVAMTVKMKTMDNLVNGDQNIEPEQEEMQQDADQKAVDIKNMYKKCHIHGLRGEIPGKPVKNNVPIKWIDLEQGKIYCVLTFINHGVGRAYWEWRNLCFNQMRGSQVTWHNKPKASSVCVQSCECPLIFDSY